MEGKEGAAEREGEMGGERDVRGDVGGVAEGEEGSLGRKDE